MGYVEPGVEPAEQAWTEVQEELGLKAPDVWLVRGDDASDTQLRRRPRIRLKRVIRARRLAGAASSFLRSCRGCLKRAMARAWPAAEPGAVPLRFR
jgi:hypothetical protein